MAETTGTRSSQIKAIDRHGNDRWLQMSDNTGVEGHVAVYDAGGNVTDGGGMPLIVSTPGSGGSLAPGTWYGQVPRGPKNGSNVTFYLDYDLASPYTILVVNGVTQRPAVDGPGSNADPEYSISGNAITMAHAPKTSDWLYIWYFINEPQTIPETEESITLTIIYDYAPSETAGGFVDARGTDHPFILYDEAAYTGRIFTFDLDTLPSGWQLLISLEQSLNMSGTDVLRIYEVYAEVTHPDSTVSRVVPTVASYLGDISAFDPLSSFHAITNANGDGSTVTYGYTGGNAISVGDYIDVSGFSTAGFNVSHALVTAAGSGTFSVANSTTGSETISGAFNNGLSAPDVDWYGTVANAANAADGNPATYATLTRLHYWPAHQGGGLIFTF